MYSVCVHIMGLVVSKLMGQCARDILIFVNITQLQAKKPTYLKKFVGWTPLEAQWNWKYPVSR
jgi:hypothetical protein